MRRLSIAVFGLTGLKWIQMESKLYQTLHSTHPHSLGHWTRPLYARLILNDAFSYVRLRQPSSVWKNARISHPLANGRLSLRAKARSKVPSLMQLWFAVAITSSLTSHWSHFQVRPRGFPAFQSRCLGTLYAVWNDHLCFCWPLWSWLHRNPANLLQSQDFGKFISTLPPCWRGLFSHVPALAFFYPAKQLWLCSVLGAFSAEPCPWTELVGKVPGNSFGPGPYT